MSHSGIEYEKECICSSNIHIFIYQNHSAIHQKLTQHIVNQLYFNFKKRAQIRLKKPQKTPKLILSAIQGLSALNKDIPIHTVIPSPDGT